MRWTFPCSLTFLSRNSHERFYFTKAAKKLSEMVNSLFFSSPTSFIYNPLEYAWAIHEQYLKLAGEGKKESGFFGNEPRTFRMAQTGVPFERFPPFVTG